MRICRSALVLSATSCAVKCTDITVPVICLFFQGSEKPWGWFSFDAKAFEEAIARLLNDSELRRKMGQAAKAYVRQHHDLNHNYQIMEDALQNIIQTADNNN